MFEAKKKPFQVRDYEFLSDVLGRARLQATDSGRRVLALVLKLAERADRRQVKREFRNLDPLTPTRDNWSKEYKKTDAVFSLYIRLRDTTGPFEPENRHLRRGYCVTCKKLKEWKSLQCGHWQKRELWGTRWYPFNSHGQCRYCNDKHKGGGEVAKHEQAIIDLHGIQVRDKILDLVVTNAGKPDLEELKRLRTIAENAIEKIRIRDENA
jgi:hypothetical protein